MKPFAECPLCGGELVERDVEKLPRGGDRSACVRVHAEVCLRCGERLCRQEDVRRLEEIRAKLRKQETEEFRPMGRFFEVA